MKDSTALVTGAARRIGKAVALALAGEGTHVVVHFNTSAAEAEQTADLARKQGVRAWTLRADLADPAQAGGLIERAAGLSGTLDFLVNNACVRMPGGLADMTPEDLLYSVSVNAWAPFALARDFARRAGGGHVVNILDSRVAGLDPGHAAYHLSKRMLADMTTALARKLAPGVRVNAVAPGLILPPDSVTEGFPPRLADLVPMGRPGTVTDVTGALLFLLRSDYLTGQVIYADGGRHLVDNWRHGA